MSKPPEYDSGYFSAPKQPELRSEFLHDTQPFVKDFSQMRTAARPEIPDSDESPPAAVTNAYVMNGQNNSRLPGRLLPGNWSVSWRVPAPQEMQAALLWAKDRIIFTWMPDRSGFLEWRLLDIGGHDIAQGRMRGYAIEIDPAQEYFFYSAPNNPVEIHSLANGQKVAGISSHVFYEANPQHLTRRGKRWIVVTKKYPYGEEVNYPNETNIEMLATDWPPAAGKDGYLKPVASSVLRAETTEANVAIGPESLWVTLPNRLYRLGLDLKPQAAWKCDFKPSGLSVDDAGRMYLFFVQHSQMTLEVLSPEGERIWQYTFPRLDSGFMTPPILGYHGMVYAVTRRKVFAFDRAGQVRWQKDLANDFAGAGVTPDNDLLIAAGSQVIAFKADGSEKIVHDFVSEKIMAAPVLTSGGQLLIATETALYSLHAVPHH